MFVHSGKLDHLLSPSAYHASDWFGRERTAIFSRSWQFFCLATQLSQNGDRFATEVAGEPVVVVNREGELFALQNICAHRHSQIAPDGCSHADRLQCPIHGWEYDTSGKLKKMPDGPSFVGVKAADHCLRPYRVERVGPFVFVNLSSDGPTFQQNLGSLAPEFHRFYSDLRHINTITSEHSVNWKVICENAVESYHVPMVHPRTYQDYRPEELHDHRLEPTFTRYGDLYPYEAERSLEARGFRIYTRLLIRNPTFQRFVHVHLFPNMMLYYGDIFSGFTVLKPLAPERTRFTSYSFVPKTTRWGWAGRRVQDLSMILFLRVARKIIGEDVGRWPPVQAGLRHSSHRGVLGAREERVYAFQRYVRDQVEGLGSVEPSKTPSDLEPAGIERISAP